jgi:nucleoside 2-deoxyribosyltransferase
MERKKVYLSAPVYNEPQGAAEEKMFEVLEAAGFNVFRAGRDDMDLLASKRAEKVEEADLLVFNLDGLMPPGAQIVAVGGVQVQLQVPFSPDIQEVINIGWAASGRADAASLSSKGKAILLPGEAEQASNAPTGMALGLPQGAIVAHLLSSPMNITDPNVLVEIGMGVALGKAILCLAVGDVQCGAHVREETVTLMESFETFEDAVKRLSESEELDQVLATLREEKADVIAETVEEEAGSQE